MFADLRNIFFAGMGLELLSVPIMWSYRDSAALEKAAEASTSTAHDAETPTAPPAAESAAPLAQQIRCARAIPYIIFVSGLAFALGSGMTVKFFPLFFKNSCRMTPIEVQAIYVAVPIIMVLFSGVGTSLSSRFGRAQTMVLLKVVGVGLLAAMAKLSDQWGLHTNDEGSGETVELQSAQIVVLVAIYLVRTGLMNCTYPLEESILMDFVPPQTRARWKSLDSIGVFGWCGSAALGGVLADKYGYSFTFLITAYVQAAATLMQATLMFIVPRSEQRDPAKDATVSPLNAAEALAVPHDAEADHSIQ